MKKYKFKYVVHLEFYSLPSQLQDIDQLYKVTVQSKAYTLQHQDKFQSTVRKR